MALVVMESLPRDIMKWKVSKKLAKMLTLTASPTDEKVLQRLQRMGPSVL